jgi:hypothetical protein
VACATRAAIVDSIFNHIAISQYQRKAGTFNVWATGQAMSLACCDAKADQALDFRQTAHAKTRPVISMAGTRNRAPDS